MAIPVLPCNGLSDNLRALMELPDESNKDTAVDFRNLPSRSMTSRVNCVRTIDPVNEITTVIYMILL